MRLIVVHFRWRYFLVFGTFVRREDLTDGNTAKQLNLQRVRMGMYFVALPNVQTCTFVSLSFARFQRRASELRRLHTNVNRVELNAQIQQRRCDSLDSHKASDIGIDDEHRKAEESHLIPVEVHLMKQPSELRSSEA